MTFAWPRGVERVPDEPWTREPLDALALGYDAVGAHGWYDNLQPTVDELAEFVRSGDIVVDYSGGTGLLIRRLVAALGDQQVGIVNVDSSPKFLRLALERLRHDERVAFRLIRWLKDQKRLQYVHEALDAPLLARGVDAIVSANAIHLYYDLDNTLASWARVLRPGGRCLVQSGNIRGPQSAWIIDDTVEATHRAALELVREDPRYARWRDAPQDDARAAAYDALRRKWFLPARPLSFYLDALAAAGLAPIDVRTKAIRVDAREWAEFLSVYHEGILGWAGGSERIEGRAPSAEDVALRQALLRDALARALDARETFEATWTYVTCTR